MDSDKRPVQSKQDFFVFVFFARMFLSSPEKPDPMGLGGSELMAGKQLRVLVHEQK